MSLESLSTRRERLLPLDSVPDWRYHPFSLVTPLGAKLSDIEIVEEEGEIFLPPEVEDLKRQLEPHAKPDFFDGPFLGIINIHSKPGGAVRVETRKTSNFAYVAAAYAFRDSEAVNPVRPLATQMTVFSPDRKKILLEIRSHALDHSSARGTFGGALKPGERDIERTLIERIATKSRHGEELYVPDLKEGQVVLTGITRNNVVNVYSAAYMITLTQEQYERAQAFAEIDSEKKDGGVRSRYYFELDVDSIDEKLHSLRRWEPSSYANILYALVAAGIRTPEEVQNILVEAEGTLQDKPMAYTYPAERVLGIGRGEGQ